MKEVQSPFRFCIVCACMAEGFMRKKCRELDTRMLNKGFIWWVSHVLKGGRNDDSFCLTGRYRRAVSVEK